MEHRIETARLWMWPYVGEDLDSLHALFTTPGVRRYLLDDEIMPRSWVASEIAANARMFRDRGFGQWALRFGGETELVGFCGFREFHDPPELQLLYGLHPDFWGRGLATEAARAVIDHAFTELGFETVVGSTDFPNAASRKVMEKAGMRIERRAEIGGLDTAVYEITHDEWLAVREGDAEDGR